MNVDSPGYKKVVEYFRHLGLTTDEITAYLHLLAKGPQTVLAISRGINTGRTKLYPLLDGLVQKQLITAHEKHYGTTYQAEPPNSIELLVKQAEKEAYNLRSDLSDALHKLKQIELTSPSSSSIQEFKGTDGLRQIYWQMSCYHGEKQIAPIKTVQKVLGSAFLAKNQAETATIYQNHPFEHEVYLYGSNVALLTPKSGVIIKNSLLADNYKTIFTTICK